MARRERTRHLIELGGLVTKAGVDQLLEDDRATLYGMLLDAARTLRGEKKEQQTALWKRLGKRTFDAEAEATGGAAPKAVQKLAPLTEQDSAQCTANYGEPR